MQVRRRAWHVPSDAIDGLRAQAARHSFTIADSARNGHLSHDGQPRVISVKQRQTCFKEAIPGVDLLCRGTP